MVTVDPVRREEQMRAAEDQAQKELGDIYELITAGEAATFDGLAKETDIRERLGVAISRCLKQLLLVRGVKSISETPFLHRGQNALRARRRQPSSRNSTSVFGNGGFFLGLNMCRITI